MTGRHLGAATLLLGTVVAVAVAARFMSPGAAASALAVDADVVALSARWDPAAIDPTKLSRLPSAARAVDAFEERIAERPTTVLNHVVLGNALLRSARETGDEASNDAAEGVFRRALEAFPQRRELRLGLARALNAQHRFEAAVGVARELHGADALDSVSVALVGDAWLGLGRYDRAFAAYRRLAEKGPRLIAWPRVAQMAQLQGRTEDAVRLVEAAAQEAVEVGAVANEQVWFLVRLSDLAFEAGQLERSLEYAELAVATLPDYPPALWVLARALAADGRYDESIRAYRRLIRIAPHPEWLAQLGDVATAAGRSEDAERAYSRVLAAGDRSGAAEDRPIALFLADRGLRPAEALLRAQRDLQARPDVDAYDVLAWSLYANGRFADAAEAMDGALRLGTKRARFQYHAGMIQARLGDDRRAERFLAEAMALNPRFDPIGADRAREELTRLRAR